MELWFIPYFETIYLKIIICILLIISMVNMFPILDTLKQYFTIYILFLTYSLQISPKKYWVGTFAPTLLNTLFYAINSEWLGISSCNILYITLLVYILYYNFIFIPKSNNKCKLLSSFTLSFYLIHIFLVIFYFKIISKKILFCEYFVKKLWFVPYFAIIHQIESIITS